MAKNPFSDPNFGASASTNTSEASNPFADPEFGKPPKPRTLATVANDTVIEVANAAAGGVASIGNFIKPGNAASGWIDKNIINAGEDAQSDVVKASKQKFRQEVDSADGIAGELGAVGKYIVQNPLLAAAQAAGSFAGPGLAVKGASGLGAMAKLAPKGIEYAGRAAGAMTGAAMAGGDAAGNAYDLSSKAGATEDQAVSAGRNASVIPAILGGLSGIVGAEGLIAGGKGFAGGTISKALKTGAVEASGEAVEEGVTQYEGQRAAMPYDKSIDPTKGVAAAAGMGAALGGITGAGASLLSGGQNQAADTGPAEREPTTSPGAADQTRPGPTPPAAPIAPDWETSPGAAAPNPYGGIDFTREVDTSGLSLADPADTIASRLKPSEVMGLNPHAGALSREVAAFVDAQPFTEVTPIESRPGIGAQRRIGEQPIIDVDAREVIDPQSTIAARLAGPSQSAPLQQAVAQLPYNPATQGDSLADQAPQAIQAATQRTQAGAAQADSGLNDPYAQAWDLLDAESRASVARSAGSRGSMARNVASKGWGDLSPNLRASISTVIESSRSPGGVISMGNQPQGTINVGNTAAPQTGSVPAAAGSPNALAQGERGAGLSGNGDGVGGQLDGTRQRVTGSGSGEVGIAPVAGRSGVAPALTQGAAPILQNRNRSNPSSIAQMQGIAADPDYGRLGFSRDFANGAPVVAGGTVPADQFGRPDVAVASDGRRIPVQYAVVEASDVLASNQVDGTPNADYGNQSVTRIRAIAGNGRIAGLQRAYGMGTSDGYAGELLGDALHGVSPDVIRSMRQPVLVRVMPVDQVTQDIGDVSNTTGNLSLSPVEQANNDAQRVSLDALQFSEDGAITSDTVRQFVRAMPQAERGGLIDTNGQPTKQAVDRINAAVFARAYGNDQLIRLFAQAQDPEARNVLSALAQVAPKMARLEGAGALDIRDVVTQAAEIAVNARREGRPLANAAAQIDMTADPMVGEVLQLFARNARTVRPVVDALGAAADFAYTEANKPAEDMFGAVPKATRSDVLGSLSPQNEQASQANLEQPARGEPVQVDAVKPATDAGAAADAAATQAGRPAEADREALTLEAQTEDDLRAKAEREDAATSQAAAEKAAEQERLRREAEARDNKARADATVDDFQLGQTADQQLSGMDDMFGTPAKEVEAAQVSVDELRQQLRSIEDRIVGAAGLAPGFIEDAMRSRKVPVPLKEQRNALRQQIRDAQGQVDEARANEVRGPDAAPSVDLGKPWALTQDEFIQAVNFKKDGPSANPWSANWGEAALDAANEEFDHPLLGKTVVGGGRFFKTKREAEVVARGAHKRAVRRALMNGETVPTGVTSAYPDLAAQQAKDQQAATGGIAGATAEGSRSAPGVKPASTIEDSGEVLEGARKMYAANYAAKLDEGMGMDVAAVPLSKSWPEPDYQRLLDDGADPWAVAFMRAVRDEIPTKPSKGWKLKGWVQKVELLRDLASRATDGRNTPGSIQATLAKHANLNGWHGRVELYEAVGHGMSLKGVTLEAGEYGIYGGEKFSPPKKIWAVNFPKAGSSWGNDVASGDTKAEAIEKFKAWHAKQGGAPAKEAKLTSFDIYTYRSKPGVIVGKRLSAGKSIDLKTFETVKEAREYKANNQDELERLLAQAKEEPAERRETNAPRVGDDHRNGADVTSEQFREAFGFRGEQFGASMPQSERQANMNMAYDALMDLAGVVGIPPRALSLNGELGLAFGARGHGGKRPAAAHYEQDTTGAVTPNRVVINLTRKNGAGSLAHEWFHAVDNYFGRMRGMKAGFLTESHADRGEGVRPEMVNAFRELMGAINRTGMKERSSKLDATRIKDYWSTGLEMAARAFESYVIAKLQDQNKSNDYLANVVNETLYAMQGAYPYPSMGEMPAIRAAFDNFFQTIQTRETEGGNVAMFSRRSENGNTLPDAIIGHKLGDLNNHPDYAAAKAGDTDAAMRIAIDMVDYAMVAKVRAAAGGADIIVPVVSVEATGRNKIPMAVAEVLAEKLGTKTETQIIQADSPKRTSMDGLDRLLTPPTFDGPVERGAAYVLVDDTLTQGGTFAALASHIRDGGGDVAAAVALTGKQYSAKLAPSPELLSQVRERFQSVEDQFRAATGYGFDALTESEARYLAKHDNAQLVRDRISEAGKSASVRANESNPRFTKGRGESLIQPRTSDAQFTAAQQITDAIAARWKNAPADIIVARNMQDASIPEAVRKHDAELKSQGATGEPRGFIYKGRVYLLSDQLKTTSDVIEVLFHESLGHYGLRGVFGDSLKSILQQVGTMRRADVVAKAREYGLFDAEKVGENASDRDVWASMTDKQRLDAAEEVLAEMSQTRPDLGFVRRAISAVRNWLRANVPGFQNLRMKDADIVQAYILPARGWVERGGVAASANRQVANEPGARYSAREQDLLFSGDEAPTSGRPGYETDLFGDPLPISAGRLAPARPARTEVRGDAQPTTGLSDTAAPEGSYRVRTIIGQEVSRKLGADTILTPEQAAQATAYLYRSAVERFDAIVTDKNGKPLAVVGSFKGALTQTSIYPGTIIAEAVRVPGAARIWFSHNHPSGKSALSDADKTLNRTLSSVFDGTSIEPMGTLAVTGKSFEHVSPDGRVTSGATSAPSSSINVPVIERELDPGNKDSDIALDSPAKAREHGSALYRDAGDPGLMILDAQHRVAAWVPVRGAMKGKLMGTGGLDAVYRAVSESNAGSVIIIHGGELDAGRGDGSVWSIAQNLGAALRGTDVRVLDIIDVNKPRSAAETGANLVAGSVFSRTQGATPAQPAAPASAWGDLKESAFDDVIFKMQDKMIDLKRVVESITKSVGAVADNVNAYLQEELFHGRAASRVAEFGNREMKPLMNQMRLAGLTLEDVEEFLHARHAKEANAVIAQRNPGNADMQDGGSGMTNADADAYFANLTPGQRSKLEASAKKVDAIIADTRKLYVQYGLEDQAVVDGWTGMFKNYIPLMRENKDGGMGIGQGFSVKGKEVKGRTGSKRKVVDIMANIAAQREKVIVRGEKNRVAQALVGLAWANPNKAFWEVRSQAPTERVYDDKLKKVVDRPDPMFKSSDNVLSAKVKDSKGNVTEQFVVFNEDNPRAVRLASAMKNLDAGNLEGLLGVSAKITRYFSAINTQYNPVFGVVNLVRDVQGAMVNLAATPLAGQQAKIAKDTISALSGIYGDIRKTRKGGQATSPWAKLWEQMQEDGGTTGYRELFKTSADREASLKAIINPDAWMDSKWGKVFTADGKLKVPMSVAKEKAGDLFNWLSDYNEAMENGVRLAAYKAALDKGMSRQQAASLSKNLTVNFNRKGQVGMQAGAVYAFFNAAMQGTARIGQTLFDMEGGDIKTIRLSSVGKKVVYGGVLLGVMQALALSAAGFDDEDPPEFLRERSLIIPTGGKTYISIPMPLGLHVIPGLGRHATEFALSGFSKPAERAVSVVGMFADAFNPIGNAGLSMQTVAPTALDPFVALSENRDWTGKPIARTSFNKAEPGHNQWKDTATGFSKTIAEAINWLSGGNEYVAGAFSPTPDQIDYLIAQVGGGVAREVSKVMQTGSSLTSGEELPTYKMPLLGRFVGSANGQASQGSAFYANLNKLNALETEIKGLRKDGKYDEAAALVRERPESSLIAFANKAERDVQKLRRDKRELIANDADRDAVRAKEDQITAVMTRLNDLTKKRVESAQ